MEKITKKVLITGIGRGIGKAIAEKFLLEGYQVHGTYFTSKEKAIELQNKYGKENLVIYGPYDFTNINETEKLIQGLMPIEFDTIICSAGIFSENDDFLNFDLNEFNKVIYCNLYTTLLLGIKLQNNIKQGGSIVILSSNDAYSGAFGSISYSLSKAALLSLTKCLCVNYGRRNIRVNSVAPGSINTDMNTPEQSFDAPGFTPINRVGQPEEVADVIYFLASSSSGFINGENITIDGGYGNVSVLLKNESSRIRKYGGYKDVYKEYEIMKKGDKLIHISPCADYAWIDNKEERELLNQRINAAKKEAIIYEILMTDKKREKELQSSPIVKQYYDNLLPQGRVYLVRKEDIIKYCPEEYKIIGAGFGVFNSKKAFIDSYVSKDDIGYTVENEHLISPLLIAFNNILKNIEEGKIKPLKLL